MQEYGHTMESIGCVARGLITSTKSAFLTENTTACPFVEHLQFCCITDALAFSLIDFSAYYENSLLQKYGRCKELMFILKLMSNRIPLELLSAQHHAISFWLYRCRLHHVEKKTTQMDPDICFEIFIQNCSIFANPPKSIFHGD